ncbi:MAG: hypothetical protein AAF288_00365 [Planctomycetota bacterium]
MTGLILLLGCPAATVAAQPQADAPAAKQNQAALRELAGRWAQTLTFTNAPDSRFERCRVGMTVRVDVPQLGKVDFTLTAEAERRGEARMEVRLADGRLFMLADRERVVWVEPQSGQLRWTPGSFELFARVSQDGESADVGFLLQAKDEQAPPQASVEFRIGDLLRAQAAQGQRIQQLGDGSLAITTSNGASQLVFVKAPDLAGDRAPLAPVHGMRYGSAAPADDPEDDPRAEPAMTLGFAPMADPQQVANTQLALAAADRLNLTVRRAGRLNLMLELRRLLGASWSDRGAEASQQLDAALRPVPPEDDPA